MSCATCGYAITGAAFAIERAKRWASDGKERPARHDKVR
jgi:hypothetical protein